MINKIKITQKYNTIPKDFELKIGRMTVITGENNSGKTNFIRTVAGEAKVNKKIVKVEFSDESDTPLTPEIVYIASENTQPAEGEAKFSAKNTSLIKNLSKLFTNLERKFKLEGQNLIVEDIENLIKKASENLREFSGMDEHALEITLNKEELDSGLIIQALIEDISGIENGAKREFADLGQGTQRVIVASILKAYVDILIERNIYTEKPILILFEEPEIYLHPRLKRSLNATIEKIAEQPNHQIIVVTHDPYFAFKNFDEKEKSIYSFKKEEGVTQVLKEGVIDGIEDELLFIFLYSFLKKEKKDLSVVKIEGFKQRKYFREDGPLNKKEEDCNDLIYIRHQIHHFGDNRYTVGLVSQKPKDYTDKNYYTDEELTNAIKKMSELLGK